MTFDPAIRVAVDAEKELRHQLRCWWITQAAFWSSPLLGLGAIAAVGLLIGLPLAMAYMAACSWIRTHQQDRLLPLALATVDATAKTAKAVERKLAIETQLDSQGIQSLMEDAWKSKAGYSELMTRLEALYDERQQELAWAAEREDAFSILKDIIGSSDDVLKDRMLSSM